MLCPWECYSRKLKDLDEKWNRLEKQLDVNFNKLFQRTLELVIDFRFLKNPVDADLTEKFQSTISRIKFTSSEMEVIENLLNLEKWDLPMPRALLSGKLILRGAKSLHSCEYKLLQEEDEVINSRIVSLMELFANTDSEEASQMVLNSLDTYKKLLIIEPELQNKLSCRTVDSLIRSLLIVLCHRKEFDQLNSMIKLLPLHRKIQIIYDESKTVLEENYIRIRECKLFICAAILQDLLQSEFARTRDKQSSLHFNIHVNLLIDLAQNESFIDRQLERLLLSANDLSVSSDYYYFAANTLRLKMPSRHETLVIKLISIGISHDLSFLEQIKYTKDNSTTKYDEKDFVAGYRKLFMALLTLGSIVKDYGLRRLCIQAASVCEPETNLCEKILSIFPEVESTNIVNYDDEMRKTLMQLRELLETFQSAIKMKISLPNTWRQASVICYDNMDFFYRRIRLSDDLKPLEYPGVEKYLKRPRTDSSEELQVPEKEELDAKCILEASKTFAADISSRFKRIQNPLTTKTSEDIPIPSEINAIFIKTLRSSADFELENGEIFMKLSDALSLESMKNYLINWFSVQDEIRKGNKPHLFFDFELKNNEELDCDKNTITNTMYQEGVVRVRYLSQSNFNIFDIENIMLYTIMNKKRLYMKEEFTDFNQNKVVDENTNQAQHAFNYIICRVLPEHSRLLKIIHIGLTSSSIYEYCLDNYTFDGIPGRYKYVKKNQEVTFNQETVTSESGKSKPEKVTRLDKQRKPGPAFRTKKEEGAQSGIIADTAPAFRTKKEERAQSGIIAATETFHASEEVMGIFALLENELSKAAGSKVTLNLKQFTDESSVHKIHLTYKSSTQLITTREKTRNNRVCHTSPYEFDLPARIHGCFTIAAVWNDTIAYDENNDNPVLQSVAEYTITGNIKFDHTTLNAKDLQIECTSGDFSGVIKLEFRMGSRSRYKGETSRDSRDCNRSSFESSPQKSYEISMSKLTPRKYIEKKSTRDKASLSSPTQQIDQLLYQAPVQIVNQMIPQIFNGSINETFNPDLTITSIVSQNHSGCFNNEQQSEISTTPAQYNEVVVNNVVKIEPGFEEQFDLVSSSIQDLPEVTIQMIPKAEKIIKVEKVSPSESNEHLDSFTNNSTVHNQVLPYKVHNTCVSTRTNKVPIILPGGTFDNFEEMILASEVAKPSNAIKLETQTPPRSPPPVGFPEVFNRRAHYESIEIKKGIDLSAERIMSQTPPEDFVDLTSEIDEPYAVKRIRPCPRSKKLLRKNTLELNVLGQSFCDDISSSEEQKRELQKQYKKVLQKERAKAPKIVHRERNSNKNSTKKCQVLLVNVLKQLSHPKANINVNFETFTMNQNPNQVPLRPDHKEYILRKADSQPLEQGPDVKTFNESTFHLIYQNSERPPNQIVTMASPTNNNQTFKAELPNAVKQQGIVQFICKTDGKIIHLTPICSNSAGGSSKKITYKVDTSGAKGPTILHHANQQIIINNQLKKSDNHNILTIIQKQDEGEKKKNPLMAVSQSPSTPTSPINTRSIYEETYAKFIQTSTSSKASDMGLLTISSSPISTPITTASATGSNIQKIGKTVIQSSTLGLPKFNQAFGKTIFTTSSQSNEQMKNKIITTKELMTSRQMTVNFTDTKPVTKITRTVSEVKSTDAGTLLSLLEADNSEKQLPTLQSALQNNLLYARPIGNGKLLASSNNNVLLTALRSGNQANNVRIITSISDNMNRGETIMAPMRISVPIQIPKLVNSSARPQTPGNYRQQIVIATTPSRLQQTTSSQSGSKLESLLMTTQPTIMKHEAEVETQQNKIEVKPKKNVDHSTLEQLREFDMVLEQVLERSSSEVTATSISSPPTPESATSSPKKQILIDGKIKAEMKINSVTITSISPSASPSPKPSSSCSSGSVGKVAPKLQEDEHTAQRILDILANYKEQVRNSPDLNNKPAPRRRANPPTNPPASKRKKVIVSSGSGSMKNSKQFGSTSDMMTDTMGSEDSSCGMGSGVASIGSMNNSPQPQDIDDQTDVSMDNNFYMEDSKRETALSPQSSSSSVATSPSHNKFPINRRLILTETKTTSSSSEASLSPTKNIVITNTPSSSSSGTTIERYAGHGSTAAVLMPGNYLLPMNVLKSGQQLAILSSNNGQKIIAVPANQLTSIGGVNGTSIILQRYLSQANESGSKQPMDNTQNTFKSVRLQQNPTVSYVSKSNNADQSGNSFYIRPIQNMNQHISEGKTFISSRTTLIKQEDDLSKDSHSKFVNDKTLITEIIQQQQQLSHTHQHPQQNFMIKLNEHQPSDPRSSSSIMFVSNSSTSNFIENKHENPKIKIEEIDYDDYMKEDAIDLLNESHEMAKSPMLTKIEVDDNTNSNHDTNNIYDDSNIKLENDHEQKFQQFPIILNSSHGKALGMHQVSTSKNIKGFLIDPSNKIVMYSDRKPAAIEKEFFNQKSFSEECADLGVDEPIASDLFPEADLLFESGSPKFDQVASHDSAMHIKKEIENGQVLLEMNYNHNMETESWLNFDTEEELVDDSQMAKASGDNSDSDVEMKPLNSF